MQGLGVFDAWTIHKGTRTARCIGDIAIRWNDQTLVGFENHGGRTYLGTAKPLGKVLKGYGNNAEDYTEGAIYRNAYGTYLHGSLLPKNPHFADYLIELALQRKYRSKFHADQATPEKLNGRIHLDQLPIDDSQQLENTPDNRAMSLLPLDDLLEWEAHASLLERLGLHDEAAAVLATQHMRKW
jgi:CobQ-like glutamine amidotransferase family enzyme